MRAMASATQEHARPPFWGTHCASFESLLHTWRAHADVVNHASVVAFLQTLVVDDARQRAIAGVEQRTDAWFAARRGRVTASNFGAVAGVSPYTSPQQALRAMLWPRKFFSNAACRWGTAQEPVAAAAFEDVLRRAAAATPSPPDRQTVRFHYPGLVVCPDLPCFGVSPDGLVVLEEKGTTTVRGLEIKCPYRKRLYGNIPPQYYAQIQGTAGLMNLHEGYYFVTWTPSEMSVDRYAFDATYFHSFLRPALERFYFERYLPRALLLAAGRLPPGQTDLVAFHVTIRLDDEEEDDNAGEHPLRFVADDTAFHVVAH